MKDQTRSVSLAFMAVLLWSTVASAFKITLDHMDPFTMVFIASIVSLISIFTVSYFNGDWKDIRSCGKKQMIRSMLTGILNPFLYYTILFISYDLLKAQIAQPINYSWPVVFTILSILILKQKISFYSVLGVLLGFSGVVIVSTGGLALYGEGIDMIGILLAVCSAFIWAIFWILNQGSGTDKGSRLFFNFLGGSIMISIFLLVRSPPIPNPEGWAGALYIGLFEMGVTFILWMKALSLSRDNARISMLIYLTPFLSLFFIGFIVGERILPPTIVGLAIIICGIFVQRMKRFRRDEISGVD